MEAFLSVARTDDDFEFLVTQSPDVLTAFGVNSDSVVIFKQVNI